MDVAESLVERFLACNGLAFICPQFELKKPDGTWSASLDFVALDFEKRMIVAVEVSEASNGGSVFSKASKFINDGYFLILNEQVSRMTLGVTDGWSSYFLGFVRNDWLVNRAKGKFPDPNVDFRPLEDTLNDYWDRRQAGLMPAPHSHMAR